MSGVLGNEINFTRFAIYLLHARPSECYVCSVNNEQRKPEAVNVERHNLVIVNSDVRY